ncbi:transcriptional regulator with XRE-family HTH domain [Streptomyces sp. SPB162]|nr:transcriptional regulator with XRE-family HTH domain [Streptomyces sp. SPB162]
MSSDAHLNELGQLLKLRRAELSPRTVGLPDTGTRRVPGLRREEVSLLADISTDCYTRLEQGRIQPSASVLAALAQVLRLADDERDHLFELVDRRSARPRRWAVPKVHARLRRLLDDLTVSPGVVIGRRTPGRRAADRPGRRTLRAGQGLQAVVEKQSRGVALSSTGTSSPAAAIPIRNSSSGRRNRAPSCHGLRALASRE